MKLFTYVTRWDHGFAPNPFHGCCTLATCKPGIRKGASEGDWVLGTGSSTRGFQGRAIFLMQVGEVSAFDEYWRDPRFLAKRPVMNGSYKQMFGDNIYHRPEPGAAWVQADSRHSRVGAEPNEFNLRRDTRTTDRVLIADHFMYWGENAPQIPPEFARFCIGRQGYSYDFSEAEVAKFLAWAHGVTNQRGRLGSPLEWQPRYARHWR